MKKRLICGIVNAVEGMTGETLIFDRVIYRPTEGFPLANEMIVPMDNPTDCCVACQKMVRPLFPFPHAMLSPLYTGDGESICANHSTITALLRRLHLRPLRRPMPHAPHSSTITRQQQYSNPPQWQRLQLHTQPSLPIPQRHHPWLVTYRHIPSVSIKPSINCLPNTKHMLNRQPRLLPGYRPGSDRLSDGVRAVDE